jgi:hypothetical protein
MRQLASNSGCAVTARLQHDLEAAGIAACVTNELQNAYFGSMQYTIWVADRAEPATVRRIYTSLVSPDTGEPALQPTRVCIAEELTRCRRCGHDLRCQAHDGVCPECEHPYRLITTLRCNACGTDVPSDFEVCWQCGVELLPATPPSI